MTSSDLEWPFHASRAISVVAELLVQLLHGQWTYTHGRTEQKIIRCFGASLERRVVLGNGAINDCH